jgi:hypothetical protein
MSLPVRERGSGVDRNFMPTYFPIGGTVASFTGAWIALKRLNGGTVHLPNRTKDLPDRERLALRFERFRAAA